MPYSQRSIRSFALRSSRLTPAQECYYQQLSSRYCLPYRNFRQEVAIGSTLYGEVQQAMWDYWQPLLSGEGLSGKRQFLCEIGFGNGAATEPLVRQNPQALYLGIEVYRIGVACLLQKTQKNSPEQRLDNLRIIEHDALEVLENMLPSASLDGLHIFFPDPWPKKRHQKRRLVQAETLVLFYRSLKPGGYLYFVTDWQEYAQAVRKTAMRQAALWRCEADSAPLFWRPQSRFEAKAQREGRSIVELCLQSLG